MIKYRPFAVLLSLVISFLAEGVFIGKSDPIHYLNERTIHRPVAKIVSRTIPSEEGMPDDLLHQHLSAEGIPVFYSQNIQTNVCFDNKCRLLVTTLYWNPTGRYLGFVLPEGEYLSKKDHDPFTVSEYEKLNKLLSDPNLPLGLIAYNELVLASRPTIVGLDGISGATSQDMLNYVIEGAAYTTHKLYTILYGPTQSAVREWSMESSSEEFLREVMVSKSEEDRFWGMEALKGKLQDFPGLTSGILEMISSPNYSISEKALSIFLPEDLNKPEIQEEIIRAFPLLDVGRKKTILDLLRGETVLLPQSVDFLTGELPQMEIPLQVQVIELYKEKHIKDENSKKVMVLLASSANSYLAQKAKDYLELVK